MGVFDDVMGSGIYRDIGADDAGKHRGKACDSCGNPIGERSYSSYDRATGKTVEKLCRKGCGTFPDPLLDIVRPLKKTRKPRR